MVVSRWKYVIIIWPLNFAEHACSTFRCTSKDVCIDPDLVCDGVNHCGDNSDEATCQSKIFAYFAKVVFAANHYSFVCFTDNASITVFGLELTWFVLLAVCTLLIISACIVGIAICVCRRYQAGADNQIRSKLGTSITYILLFEILMFRIICSQWITTITIRKASSRNIKTHIIPIRQQRYQCRETCITLRDNQGTAAKHTNCWWPKSVPFCARHVRHASVRPLRYIGEYGSEGRMVCMNNNNKHTTQTPNIVWQFWKKKQKNHLLPSRTHAFEWQTQRHGIKDRWICTNENEFIHRTILTLNRMNTSAWIMTFSDGQCIVGTFSCWAHSATSPRRVNFLQGFEYPNPY